jgi:glucose/arabinose dehydrogenase
MTDVHGLYRNWSGETSVCGDTANEKRRGNMMRFAIAALFVFLNGQAICAQVTKKEPTEDDYYKLLRYHIPDGVILEAGAIEIMPDGKVAVSSRRGEIWMIDNAYADDPAKAKFTRFAHGLHEVLGLAYKDGWLYVTQRCEVSRIKDTDGDGKADLFETVCDGWSIGGDYHEYAFGSRFDKDGNIWVVLCLTGSFTSDHPFRGWCLRVTPGGKMIPTCSGVRSPGGIGMNADGDMFYTDNQGPWNGTCGLKHLVPGGFVGHPDSFRWYSLAKNLGPAPKVPKSKSRLAVEARRIPQLVLPPVLFPYGKMGQSASGIDCDLTGGKFGPFEKQLFVGDQTHSTVPCALARTALSSSAAPAAAGAHAATSPSPSNGSSGPAKCRSRFTRCGPNTTALS